MAFKYKDKQVNFLEMEKGGEKKRVYDEVNFGHMTTAGWSPVEAAAGGTTGGTTVADTSPVTGTTDYSDPNQMMDWMSEQGLLPGDMATSVDTSQILKDQLAAQKSAIQNMYSPQIEAAKELGIAETGVAKATGTRLAGGLGLDTATQGYIQGVQREGEKRINTLTKARDEALARADVAYADQLLQSIQEEQKRQDTLRQQQFTNVMSMMNYGQTAKRTEIAEQAEQRQWEQLDLDWTKFQAGEQRANTYLDIAIAKEVRDATQDERDNALETLKIIGESGGDFSGYDPAELLKIGMMAGLPPVAIEAYIDKMARDSQMGEQLDILKIEKEIASIQNQYDQINKRSSGYLTNDIKNYNYAVSQGETRSFNEWSAVQKSSSVSGAKIGLSQAESLGLPPTTVGLTESEVARDMASNEIAGWFIESEFQKEQQSVAPEVLLKRWDILRTEYANRDNVKSEQDFARSITELNMNEIEADPTSQNIAALYNSLRAQTDLDVTDAKSIMSEYGFEEEFGQWIYIGY